MKRTMTLAAALCVLAAYLAFAPGDRRPASKTPVPPHSSGSVAATVAGATPAFDAEPERTELVHNIRVRRDRTCDLVSRDYVSPAGAMHSAWSCDQREPSTPHPYASYSNDTLDILAYSDAEAAALLGKRLIESDIGKSYDMLIRATALDGNFAHLAWLADQAFGTTRVNSSPRIEALYQQYQLASVSEHFGDFSGRTDYFRQQLEQTGAGADVLDDLDRRVMAILQQMRAIQATVHGAVAPGGQNDA